MDKEIIPMHIPIYHMIDVSTARKRVSEIATDIGYSGSLVDEIVLSVVELATNIIKYAKSGKIIIEEVKENGSRGIKIEAIDQGPGINNFEEALTDGFSTSGSLGYGLGTVHRVMDLLECHPSVNNESGSHIICFKWIRKEAEDKIQCPFDAGVSTRPHIGEKLNGDAFIIKKWSNNLLVGVIDGLGHGKYAYLASHKAIQYIENHYYLDLKSIFCGVQRSCKSTRGVVMSLAKLEWPENSLFFAGIGNVEGYLINVPQSPRFILHRGIIGKNAAQPQVTKHKWEKGQILVIYSDGISSGWKINYTKSVTEKSATEISYQILREYGKENDDATVLVVKDNQD